MAAWMSKMEGLDTWQKMERTLGQTAAGLMLGPDDQQLVGNTTWTGALHPSGSGYMWRLRGSR